MKRLIFINDDQRYWFVYFYLPLIFCVITFIVFVLFFAWVLHRYNPKMKLVRPAHEFYLNKIHYHNQVSRKEFELIDAFLEKNNGFYRNLSLPGKAKFIHRLEEFIADKLFMGSHGLAIEDQHRWLISSGAIMITFGSEDYLFKNVKEIVVYPEEFYHPALNKMLKGGSSRFQILLSWNNSLKGFKNDSDALNLVIHEFAHALEFTLKHYPSSHKRFRAYSSLLDDIAADAFRVIRNEQPDVFRRYAQTNRKEFFAVALEYFFEQSEHFVQSFPELYAHLVAALNLNPLNKKKDYILDKKFVEGMNRLLGKNSIPSELSTIANSTSDWPQWAIIIGFIFCTPFARMLDLMFQEMSVNLLLMWVLTTALTGVFAYGKYLKTDYMSPLIFGAYTVFGVTPILITSFLGLNVMCVRYNGEDRAILPIVKVNSTYGQVAIGNNRNTDYNCQFFNPIRLGKDFMQENDVEVGDSLLVTIYREEHFPGWIMYNGLDLEGFKHE